MISSTVRFFYLGRGGAQNGTHGARRSTLFADDFTQILFGHLKLENGRLISLDFGYLNHFRIINECPCDVIDQLSHSSISFVGG
jgi:hypothetical protein